MPYKPKRIQELPVKSMRKQQGASTWHICDFVLSGSDAINDRKRPLQGLKYCWNHQLSSDGHAKIEWSTLAVTLLQFSEEACWPCDPLSSVPLKERRPNEIRLYSSANPEASDSSLGVTQPANSAFTQWLSGKTEIQVLFWSFLPGLRLRFFFFFFQIIQVKRFSVCWYPDSSNAGFELIINPVWESVLCVTYV